MKPSDRINEIYYKIKKENPDLKSLTNYLDAILRYLDEQYELGQKARQELKDKLVEM